MIRSLAPVEHWKITVPISPLYSGVNYLVNIGSKSYRRWIVVFFQWGVPNLTGIITIFVRMPISLALVIIYGPWDDITVLLLKKEPWISLNNSLCRWFSFQFQNHVLLIWLFQITMWKSHKENIFSFLLIGGINFDRKRNYFFGWHILYTSINLNMVCDEIRKKFFGSWRQCGHS